MKHWKTIAFGLIGAYVGINVLGKMSCMLSMNPMIHTLSKIRCQERQDRHLTAQEVKQVITGSSYSDDGWPYSASVDGDGTNWTLRFDAAPLTWWRRAWWTLAYWQPNPQRTRSYEMSSTSMVVTCTLPDGRTFILMNDEKKSSEPAGGAHTSPAAGDVSAHP